MPRSIFKTKTPRDQFQNKHSCLQYLSVFICSFSWTSLSGFLSAALEKNDLEAEGFVSTGMLIILKETHKIDFCILAGFSGEVRGSIVNDVEVETPRRSE